MASSGRPRPAPRRVSFVCTCYPQGEGGRFACDFLLGSRRPKVKNALLIFYGCWSGAGAAAPLPLHENRVGFKVGKRFSRLFTLHSVKSRSAARMKWGFRGARSARLCAPLRVCTETGADRDLMTTEVLAGQSSVRQLLKAASVMRHTTVSAQ